MPFTPCELVVGTYDGKLYGFMLSKDSEDEFFLQSTFVVDDSSQAIRSLSFTTNGLLIATSNDCMIRIYNLRKHKHVAILDKHTSSVRCSASLVSRSSDETEEYAITGGDDKMLFLWRVRDWEAMLTLRRHRHPISSVAVHPSNFCVSSLDKDGIVVWDLTNGNSTARVPTDYPCFHHEWSGQDLLVVHPAGIQVLTVGDEPTKAMWAIPGVGHKVSSATFGIWPCKAKGDDHVISVILVGDESGILRVFQRDGSQLNVVAKFKLGDGDPELGRDSLRLKFIKDCTACHYVVGFSSGDIILFEATDLHNIEICKRFHVPGRPTSMELYRGQLDKQYLIDDPSK